MANEKNINTTEGTEKKGGFIQENAKSLTFILGGVLVLILLYVGYQQLYLSPRATTAADQIYKAQQYATIDSLQQKAIDGDGSFPGFKYRNPVFH